MLFSLYAFIIAALQQFRKLRLNGRRHFGFGEVLGWSWTRQHRVPVSEKRATTPASARPALEL